MAATSETNFGHGINASSRSTGSPMGSCTYIGHRAYLSIDFVVLVVLSTSFCKRMTMGAGQQPNRDNDISPLPQKLETQGFTSPVHSLRNGRYSRGPPGQSHGEACYLLLKCLAMLERRDLTALCTYVYL